MPDIVDLSFRVELPPLSLIEEWDKISRDRERAQRRAKRLLRTYLTDEQKKSLTKRGYFDLFVEKPYRRTRPTEKGAWAPHYDEWLSTILRRPRFYRIFDTHSDAVALRSAYVSHWQVGACVIPWTPDETIPVYDQMLALKLLIEGDEPQFWNLALWGPHYSIEESMVPRRGELIMTVPET